MEKPYIPNPPHEHWEGATNDAIFVKPVSRERRPATTAGMGGTAISGALAI